MFYAIGYPDARERDHVVAVIAETPEEALKKVLAFQCQDEGQGGWGFNGFYRIPTIEDVVEINPFAFDGVQVLWHNDYD